jgi:hypothetical protein
MGKLQNNFGRTDMSMQSLNQLVARSIVDPSIVQAFSAGNVDEILADLDFSTDLRTRLSRLEAGTWAEFAVMAYRVVKAEELAQVRIELPSPAEGLLDGEAQAGEERVA